MDHAPAGRARWRAALLWLTVTAAVAALGATVEPQVRALTTGGGPGFADLLSQACAALALVAALALWATTSSVAWSVLRTSGVPACPVGTIPSVGPVRRALLAACGVAVLASTAPAHAEAPDGPEAPLPAGVLAGLPLPDRAAAPAAHPAHPAAVQPAARTVVVRAGDSLWSITAQHLGPGAGAAEVAAYARRLHALNADTVGPDPDLIHPGQSLRLPRP